MVTIHKSSKAFVAFVSAFHLFSNAVSAQPASSGEAIYIFADGLTSNTNSTFAYPSDINGQIKLSFRGSSRTATYCALDEHIAGIGANVIGGMGLLIREIITSNTAENEFLLLFEKCVGTYGKSADFLVMQKSTADGLLNSGRWDKRYYGLLVTVPRENATALAQAYLDLTNQLESNEKSVSDRLAQLAATDGRDKIYSITLHPKNSPYTDEDTTCTIEATGRDAQIVNSTNEVIIKGINNRTVNKRNNVVRLVKFADVYKDINDLWDNVSVDSMFPGFGNCKTYIDFAKNITIVSTALTRKNVSYTIREYDSKLVIANAAGFDSVQRYDIAQQIGVNASTLIDLEKLGINSVIEYRSMMAEMKSSGYSSNEDVYILMGYMRDKNIGQRDGISAVAVKNARDRDAKEAAARQAARRESCLIKNNYYKTSNAAARSLIAKKC